MKKGTQQIVAFIFGALFVSIMLIIALEVPKPSPFQYRVFQTVLSLSAAGVAAMVPGFLQVNVSNFIRAGGALGVFAVLYFFSPAELIISYPPEEEDVSFTDQKPKILGVYPSNLFGPNQMNGLHLGVESFCSDDIGLIDINESTVSEMKDGHWTGIESDLNDALDSYNVMAVSGPSITEVTPLVLSTINKAKKTPVFITSAAPKEFLDWKSFKKEIPLYRLSTGVDQRAREISSVISELIGKNVRIAFLVEEGGSASSFGELFFNEISKSTPNFRKYLNDGEVELYKYDSGAFSDRNYQAELFSRTGIIFYLGVGSDYRDIVKHNFMKTSGNAETPLLISWMHAHSLRDFSKNRALLNGRIVEITDVDADAYTVPPDEYYIFKEKFGDVSVFTRDEAFSYDAAVHICAAYRDMKQEFLPPPGKFIRFDDLGVKHFVNKIDSLQTYGVSGVNAFNSSGDNPKRKLIISIYSDGKWMNISPKDISTFVSKKYLSKI